MEEAVRWLLDDLSIGMSPAEIFWLVTNFIGAWLSIVAVMLAAGDRRRVMRPSPPATSETTSKLRQLRGGLIVLADMSAKCESVRAIMHFGHGISGVFVIMQPEPVRYQTVVTIGFVTLWFLASSMLLLLKTIWVLKARYDYRYVRRYDRKASWKETLDGLMRDIRAETRTGLLIMRKQIPG